MSIRELLEVHDRIESENERKQKEWKARKMIMDFHPLYIREGRYDEAHLLLKFLCNGTVRVAGFGSGHSIECLLENLGFKAVYGRNYNTAQFSFRRMK